MTAQQTAAAILAVLNPALDPRQAFELDEVPAERPSEYVEITLTRMFGGQRRNCGGIGTTGYRLTARAVSQFAVSNVRKSLETCRAELEFLRLVVGDRTSTPLQFETEDPAAYDDGWFSGLHAYTFVI